MLRLTAYLTCVGLIVPTCLAFFGQPQHFPNGAGFYPPGFDSNLGNFWGSFHTRFQDMETAAHQNAAQLEGLLRRFLPGPPQPPQRRVHAPVAPQHVPLVPPPQVPNRPQVFDREPLGTEHDEEDPFGASPFFSGSVEDYGTGEFDAGNFGASGLFHALGISGAGRLPSPWWQGPNVCVSREEFHEGSDETKKPERSTEEDVEDAGRSQREISSVGASSFIVDNGDGTSRYTTCQQTPSKYTCTTVVQKDGMKNTNVVRHQCCHGYKRANNACRKVKLNDVLETARGMGAAMFAQTIEASGLDTKSLRKRNVTLFAPSDRAMKGYNAEILAAQNEVDVYVHQRQQRDVEAVDDDNQLPPILAKDLKEMVLSHMVPQLIDFSDVVDEQVLYTENKENSTIRLNLYPGSPLLIGSQRPLMTANCVPVTSEESADNGAVVIVEQVLLPVTKSLAALIQDNPRLATFKSLLENTNQWENLDKPGHWTVFAPTEDAFERLPAGVLKRLLDGKGCVDNVVHHHVVEHTLCSACVRGEVSTVSLANEPLRLARAQGELEGTEAEEVHVESAIITKPDVTATNGVLHLIDAVLLPKSARTLTQALADRGLTSLVKALGARGLLEHVDSLKNVTVFAPSEVAMKRVRNSEESLSRDELMYHVAHGEIASCDFKNNMEMFSHKTEIPMRLNLYHTMPTFGIGPMKATLQCSRLVNVDEQACGAVVHEIDRVAPLPSGDILHTLKEQKQFSILLEIINGTRYEERLKQEDGAPLTLLAPTDEAFKQIPTEQFENFRADKEFREQVLSKHILTDVVCCDGVATPNWPFTNYVQTDYGTRLPLRRGSAGELNVGPLPVSTCDIMATNGVIHAVNAVRLGNTLSRRSQIAAPQKGSSSISVRSPQNPNVEVQLYGL